MIIWPILIYRNPFWKNIFWKCIKGALPTSVKWLLDIWMVPWNSSRISWLLPQISEFPTLIEDNFIVKPQDLLWLFISRFVCFSLIMGCIKFSYDLRTLSKVQLKKYWIGLQNYWLGFSMIFFLNSKSKIREKQA